MFTEAENVRVLQQAKQIADEIWFMVRKWDWLAKTTVGTQIIRSSDSIGANIAEGFGRQYGLDA